MIDQPTTKLAEDRAAQLLRDPDSIQDELYRRIRADAKARISRHTSIVGQDVPDDLDPGSSCLELTTSQRGKQSC